MIEKQLLTGIITDLLQNSSMFLVDLTVSQSNEIEVEIDSMERVSIDDCSSLSRSIEAKLDRDKEDFSLTVFSSGIGYPFKVFRQYQKAIGKPVEIKKNDGTKIIGVLENCKQDDDAILITVSYEQKEKLEGEKRPQMVRHEDEIIIHDDILVKEIITIK